MAKINSTRFQVQSKISFSLKFKPSDIRPKLAKDARNIHAPAKIKLDGCSIAEFTAASSDASPPLLVFITPSHTLNVTYICNIGRTNDFYKYTNSTLFTLANV